MYLQRALPLPSFILAVFMRDLIAAPDLASFARNEGSVFTVRSASDVEIVLDEVEARPAPGNEWERFTLAFSGPVAERFESGIHRIDHPRLDAFDMDVRPVQTMHATPDRIHYQATFTRATPGDTASGPQADTSRRGFFGKLATALGGAGLLGGLVGGGAAQAAPQETASQGARSSEPYIGEIILFGGTFAIRGYAECNGQLLAISQNSALFSLLGTVYGGDGRTTFGLPDLRGRAPLHRGQGAGLSNRRLGETGGAEQVTLNTNDLPNHTHAAALPVSTDAADATAPSGNVLGVQPDARGTVPVYSTGNRDASMPVTMGATGNSQAHNNMPPFAVVSYQIALLGLFPSRS